MPQTPLPNQSIITQSNALVGKQPASQPMATETAGAGGSDPSPETRPSPPTGGIKRIRQACAGCRQKKIKCSGDRPKCHHCRRTRHPCHYEPYSVTTAALAGDVSTSLLASLNNVELLRRLSTIESKLAALSDQGPNNASSRSIDGDPPFNAQNNFPPQPASLGVPHHPESTSPQHPQPPSFTAGFNDLDLHPTYTSEFQAQTSGLSPNITDRDLSSAPRSYSTLPPDPVLQSLLDAYFLHAHNQPYSYFHEQSFRNKLACGMLPKCLVFAVIASALRFTSSDYFGDATQEAIEGYAREAWLSVLNDYMTTENSPSLHVSQTTNLLAIIDFTAGRTSSGWLKIGLAVRICQDLQLRKESEEPLPAIEEEERRRCFWSVYLLDKLVSCGRGRHIAILDEECQVQLPCDEETFRNGGWGKAAKLQQLFSWNTDMSEVGGDFSLTILAASALGRCTRYVFHDRVVEDALPWDSRSEFGSISSFLFLVESRLGVEDRSIESIIDASRGEDGTIDHQAVGHVLFAHTIFHLCHCLLNNPFLLRMRLQRLKQKPPSGFLSRAFQTSSDHAKKLVDLLYNAGSAGCHVGASFYAYSTSLACGILLVNLHAEQEKTGQRYSSLMDSTKRGLDLLEQLGKLWCHASRMHRRLLSFHTLADLFTPLLDTHATTTVDPRWEQTLWPMVDYGAMCSEPDLILPGPDFAIEQELPSPWPVDIPLDLPENTGDFDLQQNPHFTDYMELFGSPNMTSLLDMASRGG